jgi:hypothetical protein
MTDDYSDNVAQMQSTRDPYPADSESLAVSTAEEIEGIRYVLKEMHGGAQWYISALLFSSAGGVLTGPLSWSESGDEYLQIPRLTTTQRNALTPADGMVIFNTTDAKFQVRQGAAWLSLSTITGTEVLANKTLTTPTIADLSNATHDHLDVAEGGALGADSVDTTQIVNDAVTQDKIVSSAVGQGELKTAQGEVSTQSDILVNLTLPGGSYGFYPQIKCTTTGGTAFGEAFIVGVTTNPTSYVTNISMKDNSLGSGTIFAQQRYIQASPPYMLGDKEWGHFLFLLRKLGTGEVISTYNAEDPPWAYNGKVWLPKDHKDRIVEVPHPFADYWDKDPAVDGLEIVLVDLSGVDVTKWLTDNWKIGKSILEDLGSVLTGMGTDKLWSDYTVPTIPKFTDKVKVIKP